MRYGEIFMPIDRTAGKWYNISREGEMKMFINFAHRGASSYAPENTMSAFYMGLRMGANGIETDIQCTGDGILVLFHDDTLDRVTGQSGKIVDYTYEQLREMRVKNETSGEEDVIVRLEDFLRYFGFRDLHFAIELKEEGTEGETVSMLDAFGMKEKCVITSFHFGCIRKVKELRPDFRVGFLADDFDDRAISEFAEIGGEQLCPKATRLTPEKVAAWHGMGYNVRAWGVSNPELMRSAYAAGVDGMTVNFPDLLTAHLRETQEK